MKKLLCALLMMFLSTSLASAADFRDLSWGMSMQEVIKKESVTLEAIDSSSVFSTLGGETTIARLRTYLVLDFLENKLVRASYIFANENSNNDLYHADFNNVAKLLTDIYGKPVKQDHYLPKGWENNVGLALSSGRAYYENKWNAKNGNFIIQSLHGNNYKIFHYIEYSSYANQNAIKKAESEYKKKGL